MYSNRCQLWFVSSIYVMKFQSEYLAFDRPLMEEFLYTQNKIEGILAKKHCSRKNVPLNKLSLKKLFRWHRKRKKVFARVKKPFIYTLYTYARFWMSRRETLPLSKICLNIECVTVEDLSLFPYYALPTNSSSYRIKFFLNFFWLLK